MEKLDAGYVLAAIDHFKSFVKEAIDADEDLLIGEDVLDFLVEAFDAYLGSWEKQPWEKQPWETEAKPRVFIAKKEDEA